MGSRPNIAPNPADPSAMLAGMLNTTIAITSALTRPRMAAQCAAMRRKARVPSSTTIGIAARIVDRTALFRGS